MTTTHTAPPPMLDMTIIKMLRSFREEGGPDPVAELTELFVTDGNESLSNMRAALATGDEAAARWAAHTLKGMSGSIGAARLSAMTEDFENAGPGAIDSGRLTQLELEFFRVSQALIAA